MILVSILKHNPKGSRGMKKIENKLKIVKQENLIEFISHGEYHAIKKSALKKVFTEWKKEQNKLDEPEL